MDGEALGRMVGFIAESCARRWPLWDISIDNGRGLSIVVHVCQTVVRDDDKPLHLSARHAWDFHVLNRMNAALLPGRIDAEIEAVDLRLRLEIDRHAAAARIGARE